MKSSSLILMALLFVAFVAFVAPLIPPTISTSIHAQYHSKNGFQSKLIHVDHNKSLTKIELLRRAIKRGENRMQLLKSKIMAGPPIVSPIQYAFGEYLMQFSIGTPSQSPNTAIMDTGSDFIWIQCKPCNPCFNQSTPIFEPKESLFYSKLGCCTNLCKALIPEQFTCNNSYCNFYYRYGFDGSGFTRGALAIETFTFEGKVKVLRIVFGCGFSTKGDFSTSSGIIGLGRGNLSLVFQMNQPRFSYCLPTFGSGGTGTLRMGCQATNPTDVHVNTTPFIKNRYDPNKNYYYLSLEGITIGRTRLAVNKSTFAIRKDGSGGMFIDSGFTLTYLVDNAFDQVKNELTRQLGLNTVDGSDMGLDVCFNIKYHPKKFKYPVILFHFGNKVNLELRRENYLYTDNGVGCLAMANTTWFSILGNYQQQNTLVVYDLAKESVLSAQL